MQGERNKKSTRKKATTQKGKTASKRTKKSNDRTLKQRMVYWCINLTLLGVTLMGTFFTLVYIGAFGAMPTAEELSKVKNPVASEVYSADGKLLGRYYAVNRSNVSYNEISSNVINALVATEDARFYDHRGIDEMALLRVFVKSIILQDKSAGGGSTLSQQVAKNIFGRNDYWWFTMPVNKLREGIIAYRLEKAFSKQEILTLYLNTVPFGDNVYGIKIASEHFFSKTPKYLTVPEAATLVGILKANSYYNPIKNKERATKRRNVVIDQMVKYSYIATVAEGEKYKRAPMVTRESNITYNTGLAAYYRAHILPKIKKDFPEYNVYTDGLKIYTTIDSRMQSIAEESLKEHLKTVQSTFDSHWKASKPWTKKPSILQSAQHKTVRYRRAKAAGLTDAQIKTQFETKRSMTLRVNGVKKKVNFSPLDSLQHELMRMQGSVLAIDPNNYQVKAWVGGSDFRTYKYDHVQAKRQVGSIFKPIVYLAALQEGVAPDRYISNRRETYKEFDNWSPRNSNGKYEGYYSLEGALTHSVNTVAVKVALETGVDDVIDVANELGIKNDLPEYPSIALGVADLSLFEMVTAYSGFAAQGVHREPQFLTRIETDSGQVLAKYETSKPLRVLRKENADIMNHYLLSVVDSGSGRRIRSQFGLKNDIAGKTGTTQKGADGWFIGYTPKVVVGAWVGADNPSIHFRTIKYGQGAYLALPIVGKFYQDLYKQRDFKSWKQAKFTPPPYRTLKTLDEPHYVLDLNKRKKIIDWGNIFKKKKEEDPELEKSSPQPDREDTKEERKKRRKSWFRRIGNAFKKNDNE